MAKNGLTTIFDDTAKVIDGIAKLTTTRVMVGVPAEKGGRRDGEPINNAALLYIHEHGAPEAGIPARPTLMPGIQSAQKDINSGLEKTGKAALDGRPEAVDRGLTAVGLKAQSAIRAKFGSDELAPLAASTLEARRARGRTGDKPLLDTGQLRNSVNFVIRKV
jgi:hypothetical protein